LVYRHRVFREPATAAAAAAVLGRCVAELATGRGHRDAPVGEDWRDNVGDYLGDGVWTVFLVGGEQVAAWSEGELVVHRSGIWDQPLDDVPHTRVPWSWLMVGLEDERGGGSLEKHHPLTEAILATTIEDELISWLEPVGVDSLSVFGILRSSSGPARRSMRKLPGQLLVSEPIEPALLEGGRDQPGLQHWWSQLLDRVGARYNLGDRSDLARPPYAPAIPPDEDELRILVGPGIHVPEHLLASISSALIDLGADVDDWVGHAQAVGLPIAGSEMPLYLRHGASIARAAGFVVVNPPASP
jgi:hypothetical protein